jgi:hypothetical protein
MHGAFVRLVIYDNDAGGIPVAWLSGDYAMDRCDDLAYELIQWFKDNRNVSLMAMSSVLDEMHDPLGIFVLNDERVETAVGIFYHTLITYKLP